MANTVNSRIPAVPDVVELAKTLVGFDTMPETGDERACQDFLAGLLAEAGFKVRVDRFGADRANLYAWLEDEPERPSLCFAGHIDTVALHGGQWRHDPLRAEAADGRIFGRGSCDMKGGVAAMLCAALAARPRLAPGSDLRLHVYGGEEAGCLGSAHMAQEHPEQLNSVGAVVVAEPTAVALSVGHKGALWLKITASGRAAHGSMPQYGDNALTKAMAAANLLASSAVTHAKHAHMGESTLTLTTLHSGASHNSVPDAACFTVDIRTVPGQDPERILDDIRKLVGELHCSVEVLQCIHSLWTPPENPWVGRVAEILRGNDPTGNREAAVTQFFTDGASVRLARPEIPIVILGPGEPSLAHQTDEWCEIGQLRRAEAAYSGIIADWYAL